MVGLVLTHRFATNYQHEQWQQKLKTQAALISQEVDYELAKFEQLPSIQCHNPSLPSAVKRGTFYAKLNQLLAHCLKQTQQERIKVHSGVDNCSFVTC